ncbi:uncharacterized protein LOC117334666 [Pecten maximus]|uniref:uncharacterized protein LOC117334666 n=1 Tax=Pecten maximus TaxID=6579 RepID=UPI00145870BB|nr:uncharacterized protein LOC117334666 [Pecten maximus]
MGSCNGSIENTSQVSKLSTETNHTAVSIPTAKSHNSVLKSSLKKAVMSDTTTIMSYNDTQPNTRKVSIKPGTHSPTSSKRPPMRTISKITRDEDEKLYTRFPEMKETFDGLITLGPWLSSLIEEGDDPDEPDYDEVEKQLQIKVLDKFDAFKEPDQRKLMGNMMAKNGFVQALGDFYEFLLKALPLPEFTLAETDEKDEGITVVEQLRQIFWNLSDNSVEFCAEIVENTDMIRFLVIDLLAMRSREFEIIKEDSFPYLSAVGILHNVARSGVTKTCFTVVVDDKKPPTNALDVLMPFLETKNTHIKLITLLGLAHIVNEQQNEVLTANASLFDFLLETMKTAIKNKDRRQYGFSVEELLDGLANLAKNDRNKIIIMDKKAFPILKDIIMKGKSSKEKAEALKVIWELSFMSKNKKIFMGDKDFWKKIYTLQSDSDEDMAKAAQGACFVITDGDVRRQAPPGIKSFQKTLPVLPRAEKADEEQHIMISYNWADQRMLLKVRDCLQEVGYKVWMDVDNMEGDILDAMARAVENAHIVLMCYSEKYKESKNCRTEAQYAYQVSKEIIPVLMQTKYKPDGWLGILVGSKLFYEFTNKYPFENKMKELIRELENRFRIMSKKDPTPKLQSVVSAKLMQGKQEDLAKKTLMISWSKNDLDEWLSKNKLEALDGLKSLNGAQLAFLYKLFRRAPEFFYRCLEEKLCLRSLEDLMRFTDALEKLSEEQPEINQLLL